MDFIRHWNTPTLAAASIALTALSVHMFFTLTAISPPPADYVQTLARSRFPAAEKASPLRGHVAIVTGSSDGLGKSIAIDLFQLGSTVVIASRSLVKCQQVASEITALGGSGKMVAMELDTSDLDSIKAFVLKFRESYKTLDWLVCNAGIHYVSSGTSDFKSKQGFDRAFATNYLGHFLLTELLLPILEKTGQSRGLPTRVVNVASTYHALSDGRFLKIQGESGPYAARGDVVDKVQREESYANNKLAQILHSKELARRKRGGEHVQFASVCPGWVGTNILPKDIGGRIVHNRAFKVKDASLCTMGALFSPQVTGGEFITNYKNFFLEQSWTSSFFSVVTWLKIRTPVTHLLAMYVLMTQRFSFKCWFSTSSPESYDEALAHDLYDWSIKTVESWNK